MGLTGHIHALCERRNVGIDVMKVYAGGDLLKADQSMFGKAMTPVQALNYALTRPAVAAVMAGCRSISCTGNMKQLGQAYFNYCPDRNMTPPVSKSGRRRVDLLVPYLTAKSERNSGNVFVCPSDRRPDDKKMVYDTSDINKLSYGINQCYPANRESETPILWNGINVNLIRSPS